MSCTFLDLDIIVENNIFITWLYDKRRDLSFKVVSLPNMKSNIPTAPTYGIDFKIMLRSYAVYYKVKLLTRQLIIQNFNKHMLNHKLACFLRNRPACILYISNSSFKGSICGTLLS